MQVLMKIIRNILLVVIMLTTVSAFAQSISNTKKLSFKTNLRMSIYHLPGYNAERAIYYLEQHVSYPINTRFSFGGGLGINAYPFLLGLPIFIDGMYHFKPIKKVAPYFYQSFGRNIKVGSVFFKSNRLLGSFGANIKVSKKVILVPELGYSMLWDKYGGGAFSFIIGIGIKY